MNNFKNLLIAILTGLLALSLFTQPAQSAPKTYDALKLVQYEACLDAQLNWDIAVMQANGGNGTLYVSDAITKKCNSYKP
jgi:hypothetical protein